MILTIKGRVVRLTKVVLATLFILVLSLCLHACSQGPDASVKYVSGSGESIETIDVSDLSGGVCADVNDVKLGENAVTAYINNFRYAQELQDDNEWGQWLFDNGYTMDGMRADTVDYFVNQELIAQAAKSEGVEVDESEVEKAVSDVCDSLNGEDLSEALLEQGKNEETYKDEVRMTLLQNALQKKVVSAAEVSDAELLDQYITYYPNDVSSDATTLDGIDQTKVDNLRKALKASKEQQSLSKWMQEFKENSKVVTHMMPDGLPYVVDLTPYEEAADAAQSTASNSTNSNVVNNTNANSNSDSQN